MTEPEKESFLKGLFLGLLRKLPAPRRGRAYRESAASLVLVTTRRCNLKCATCLKGASAAEDLDLGLLDRLFEDAKRVGFDSVSLSGGEPVLHPQFRELLAKIASHGLNIGLVTNGLEYRRYLELLAPYADRVSFVAVSLDSHVRHINDEVRGPGAMDAAVAAARAFRKAGYTLKISHVVNRRNMHYLEGFADFVNSELKPFRLNIGSVISSGDNAALVLTPEEKTQLRGELRGLKRRHPNIAIATSTGYFEGVNYCSRFGGLGGLTVGTSGEILFCCDNPGAGFPLGHLKTDSFGRITEEFFRLQAGIKTALVREKLAGGPRSPTDCDLCARLLSGLTGKDGRRAA